MKNFRTVAAAAALLALPVSAAMAQSTHAQRHSIRARQQNQQARIDHGVRDGQITPQGAAHAEANQARIASQQHAMRQSDGGHLTAGDRHQLAREQNATSRGIYNRNHNGYTDPGVAPK